jgi:membrane fusion protein, copper/silver efflux system
MKSDMRKLVLLVLLLIILTASFLAGSWVSKRDAAKNRVSDIKPPQESDEPGNDPSSMRPGTVKITPEKQQAIGVRLGLVEKKPITHILRVLGRVAADETRIYRIIAATDGWILQTFSNSTGTLVQKNEVLASFYAPELVTNQKLYLNWLAGLDRLRTTRSDSPDRGALATYVQGYPIENLQKLGMGDLQIEEIVRTGIITTNIHLRTPASGFVVARNVSPDQRFEKGNELFRIVDLSHVWILADIFENESQYLQPGKSIKISLPHQGKTFQAKMSDALPLFDPATRTLKVRLETDNPGYALKPDMFVDLELPISLPPVITVPTDAVLDSGLKKTVFIDRGSGFFEPREVETGRRVGNRVEIVRGLAAGERIVLSGNFLIDSESRLELVATGMVGTLSKDPVCGMEVAISKAEKAGRKSVFRDVHYYFCSDECKALFDKNPVKYAEKSPEKDSSRDRGVSPKPPESEGKKR